MKNQKTKYREISEYDNYPIPAPDPNLTEEEKKRIIAEADAELKKLFEERDKYILKADL